METIDAGRVLYKRDSKGKLRVWSMEQAGNKHRTVAGLADGKLTYSEWTICIGKQGRTDEEQAAFEINSGYTYQLEREYFETPEEADGPARFFKPMLAEKWDETDWDEIQRIIAKRRTSTRSLNGTGVYAQPKLDGFRCIAQASGLTSREGQPIVSVPHVMAALAPFFHEFPDAVLDGELYNHLLRDDFGELSSILKQQKPTAEDLEKSARLAQFHVYDYPAPFIQNLPFGERSEILAQDLDGMGVLHTDIIQLVETVAVQNEEHFEQLVSRWRDNGYEGGMGRLDIAYEQKRSMGVLKRKFREDSEFEVVAIEEGKGNYTGHAKRVTCRLPDGRTFGAGIKGKKPFLKELLGQSHKVATVSHHGWTPDGIPREGVATKWHGEGRTL